ncbi:MAG: toprim domain-containing protein [Hyphomonadaceae bacterium]|nr:toprim domain-containing protein [Hyphomonadaceae bacterium]
MTTLARIVDAFGGALFDAGRRALIPGPGHARGDRSVSLYDAGDGRILIHCFSPRDDWRAVRDILARGGFLDGRHSSSPASSPASSIAAPASRAPVVQPAVEDRSARARRIWGEGAGLKGSPAEAYLEGRGVCVAEGPDNGATLDALRFHPTMTSLDDRVRRPALLSAILSQNGVLQGVEATLLARDGAGVRKAAAATPRRIIGRLMGGAVRLFQTSDVLVVAEGVETALSAAHALRAPAWAILSAANLARFEPPAEVHRLIVAADADAAGMRAAHALRARLRGALDGVEIIAPPEGFNDWNDVVRARRTLK